MPAIPVIGRRAPWLLAAAVVVAACGSSSGGRTLGTSGPSTTAAPTTSAPGVATVHVGVPVQLQVGQVVHVSYGTVNPSVGDSWSVTEKPDPAIVADLGAGYHSSCQAGETGCGGTGWEVFKAKAPGSTTASFQYCFRSQPPQCVLAGGRPPPAPVVTAFTVR